MNIIEAGKTDSYTDIKFSLRTSRIEEFLLLGNSLRINLQTLIAERTLGGQIKRKFYKKLGDILNQKPFQEEDTNLGLNHGEKKKSDETFFVNKVLRFRPRLVGAIATYSLLTNTTYENIVEQGGMDTFYLFWALASIQDDFIDRLQKTDGQKRSYAERKKAIAQAIFGDDRKFYRATFYLLKTGVKNSSILCPESKDYLISKIANWYKFLIQQESTVIDTPLIEMDFAYSRRYREDQNTYAGYALVAVLNGNSCLNPKRQALEITLPKISYLTQIIDDIADTAEDLSAGRPSYAVGALVEHPAELQNVRDLIVKRGAVKFTPHLLYKVAPESYQQVNKAFLAYRTSLEDAMDRDGRSIGLLAQGMYNYFPYIRDIIYLINPNAANF